MDALSGLYSDGTKKFRRIYFGVLAIDRYIETWETSGHAFMYVGASFL